MAMVCKKCQAKIIDMQKRLEEIMSRENVDLIDVRAIAKMLHNTLSMMAGHGDALPAPKEDEHRHVH